MEINVDGEEVGTGSLHMRVNGASGDSGPTSGICSLTYKSDAEGTKWNDGVGAHWGNGLRVWIY